MKGRPLNASVGKSQPAELSSQAITSRLRNSASRLLERDETACARLLVPPLRRHRGVGPSRVALLLLLRTRHARSRVSWIVLGARCGALRRAPQMSRTRVLAFDTKKCKGCQDGPGDKQPQYLRWRRLLITKRGAVEKNDPTQRTKLQKVEGPGGSRTPVPRIRT